MKHQKGRFTLPGQSGYEKLTLELAQRWGADVIRDSDGTRLSDDILDAGFSIYSTICIIRNHNQWLENALDKQQQTFLMTRPRVATKDTLTVSLLEDFFEEQFAVNNSPESLAYWQVYDRTTNQELPRSQWDFNQEDGTVILRNITPWHKYTVSFLAYRIWEEISMYNHTTNNWDTEHLRQVDPIYPEVQSYLLEWLDTWCKDHPETDVVRFTSLFYNFVWIWGSDKRNPHLFTDWASYDFTVSPYALALFTEQYGIEMTAEDFVNKGHFRSTHTVPDYRKRKWMEFIGDFVIDFGSQLVRLVQSYGKKAYVFYDDSWVGLEPYSGRFQEFGFDGLIKCVFSGFEARLCSNVEVETHELRLHPYLFPTGLGGLPTFAKGGDPKRDAEYYWSKIRRALMLQPVQRLGLGGYLSLVEDYPEFVDYIEDLTQEFHTIVDLHEKDAPRLLPPTVGILTSWGKLRTWTLSGHFHETDDHDLIHVLESLSGLPFTVEFFSFEDLAGGIPKNIDILINAGMENSAWSGGEYWQSTQLVETLTQWVYNGGVLLGIGEPSATTGFDTRFRMAHVLGVDSADIWRARHGMWNFRQQAPAWVPSENTLAPLPTIYLTDGKAKALLAEEDLPTFTAYEFGKGKGLYMSSFQETKRNTALLRDSILWATGNKVTQDYVSDNPALESYYYPGHNTLAVLNSSNVKQSASISAKGNIIDVTLPPYGFSTIVLDEI